MRQVPQSPWGGDRTSHHEPFAHGFDEYSGSTVMALAGVTTSSLYAFGTILSILVVVLQSHLKGFETNKASNSGPYPLPSLLAALRTAF
jgi:hypothetical protein